MSCYEERVNFQIKINLVEFIWAAHVNLNKSQEYIFMRNNFSTVPWLTDGFVR